MTSNSEPTQGTARVLNKRTDTIPDGAVYVGRPTKWGNPWRVEDWGRVGAIEAYRQWLEGNADCEAYVGDKAPDPKELQGKDLVCWCAPAACHADVLLEIANDF